MPDWGESASAPVQELPDLALGIVGRTDVSTCHLDRGLKGLKEQESQGWWVGGSPLRIGPLSWVLRYT